MLKIYIIDELEWTLHHNHRHGLVESTVRMALNFEACFVLREVYVRERVSEISVLKCQ